MTRRELFQLTAAALASSKTGLPVTVVNAIANASDWKPGFFDQRQIDAAMAVSECIIPRTDTPGANDAKVYRYMDLLLERGKEEDRTAFTKGLEALDENAQSQYRVTFTKCSPDQQSSLLAALENADDRFFKQAKLLTVKIFINTPEGYKELNRFGVPRTYNGCEA